MDSDKKEHLRLVNDGAFAKQGSTLLPYCTDSAGVASWHIERDIDLPA
jgi:hypothetical protein